MRRARNAEREIARKFADAGLALCRTWGALLRQALKPARRTRMGASGKEVSDMEAFGKVPPGYILYTSVQVHPLHRLSSRWRTEEVRHVHVPL